MIDIQFIEFYIKKKYDQNMCQYFDVSKPVLSVWSANELKHHLESLFTEGMSWNNHGDWHVDHIKPLSLFDKNTDASIVNSLDNLQPLWAEDNLSKSNKYNQK